MSQPQRPRTIGELLAEVRRNPPYIQPRVLRRLRRGRRWYDDYEREKELDRRTVEAEWQESS